MDVHMRSMLHHRELENLRGRDCSHECRVCRVTVVGLSAYAKHISSQQHKDKVDALDHEEEKDEDDEEYFDKELIQLIIQRREQSRHEDVCSTSKEKETDRYLRRRELGPQDWHCDPSQRGWQWQKEGFKNCRQGNGPHPALNLNHSRHFTSSRERDSWHLNNLSSHHQIHGKGSGSWPSNAGSQSSWHHRSPGRNLHWHQEENAHFPILPSRGSSGNWQHNRYSGKQWNFSSSADEFPQGRNRPVRHCDSTQEKEPSWNNSNCKTFNKERFTWKKMETRNDKSHTSPLAIDTSCKLHEGLTRDNLAEENVFDSKFPEKPSNPSTEKLLLSPGKTSNSSKDKACRWTPYPSQKILEVQESLETTSASKASELNHNDLRRAPVGCANKVKVTNQVFPDTCGQSEIDKAYLRWLKSPRKLSLKSPLHEVPDSKSSSTKRDQRNPLKGVKLQPPSTSAERPNQLSALNLDTVRSNAYVSKLRSASRGTTKVLKEPQESNPEELADSLNDVLHKAQVLLGNRQSIQTSCIPLRKNASVGPDTVFEMRRPIKMEDCFTEDILEVSNEFIIGSGAEVSIASNGFSLSHDNPHLPAEDPGNVENCQEEIVSPNPEASPMPMESTGKSFSAQNSTESFDEGCEAAHLSQDDLEPESFENCPDLELLKGPNNSSTPILPELSKLGLPASLKRDLTRHIGSRSKTGTHLPEPNLNSARRIRNVSGHRKNEAEKDSGLKPTLRQILNASRRNINWEQVINHVTKKKLESGKGLPRFGIEMVAQVQSEQDGLDFEVETDLGIERFHWEEAPTCLLAARKRSLSESSVAVEKASVYDLFNDCGLETHEEPIPTRSPPFEPNYSDHISTMMVQPKEELESRSTTSPAIDTTVFSSLPLAESSQSQKRDVQNPTTLESPSTFQNIGDDENVSTANDFRAGSPPDVGTDSCTSGTEQYDGQGTGKKRRATGDCSFPEMPSIERNNKRRRIRGKKERSQVDHLLSISLREEELNDTLLGVDNSLLQARAALQAAYMEVQRLLAQKQQITMEMSAMRTQRIQILQGLQGSYEPPADTVAESSCSFPQIPIVSPDDVINFLLETPSYLAAPSSAASTALPTPVRVCTPPTLKKASVAPVVPDSSVSVKQEPLTPDDHENIVSPRAQAVTSPEANGEAGQSTSVYPIITATMSLSELTNEFPPLNFVEPFDRSRYSDVLSRLITHSPANQDDHSCSRNFLVPFENQSHSQTAHSMSPALETSNCLAGLQEEQQAESTNESKMGRKKKFRKKKSLRAAHVPDNSDTEQDMDTIKPPRKNRSRRCSKETTVSTSTTSVEQELETAVQDVERNDGADSNTEVELVEVPSHQFEVVAVDFESEEEKPDSPSKTDLNNHMGLSKVSSETYNEVTSTSELGCSYPDEVLKEVVNRQRAPLQSKNSSEVSSEPGDDEEPTEGRFEGHSSSVNSMQIFSSLLYTCSADKTVRAYNIATRQCVGIFEGHTSKVNCLLVTNTNGKSSSLFTGSSDHTIRCYSVKTQTFVEQLNLGERVLCLHARWKILYTGLANGTVVTFSLKNNKKIDMFECHGPRAVSCLATAQEGSRRLLLVGSYDCTISVRDARNGLLLRALEGHTKTVLCMKVVNDLVFSGSSDQSVHAHNIHTGELVRIYKGHNHAVTVVNILGKVMVTACLDKFVRVYELQSHDRLQVYGGHSDMIMCMAIHKSMIYTGCYDGSVQAVRLDLMQNYRCWWHGCSLIFGVVDHLKQHLVTDHTNPNFQTLKCRWKNCDAFFTARRSSKQDVVGHIERHADEDSRLNILYRTFGFIYKLN
uniref:Zinc finger protein 106 n=1 Tax=Leptobrachium leishanense TaxID=445787 RepID=A0A8C5QB29_9ANUR